MNRNEEIEKVAREFSDLLVDTAVWSCGQRVVTVQIDAPVVVALRDALALPKEPTPVEQAREAFDRASGALEYHTLRGISSGLTWDQFQDIRDQLMATQNEAWHALLAAENEAQQAEVGEGDETSCPNR